MQLMVYVLSRHKNKALLDTGPSWTAFGLTADNKDGDVLFNMSGYIRFDLTLDFLDD